MRHPVSTYECPNLPEHNLHFWLAKWLDLARAGWIVIVICSDAYALVLFAF